MALAAVFSDRLVLPQEWATLLLVAAVTVLDQGDLVEVPIGGTAVWIVAVGAGSLAFGNRVAGRQFHLCPLLAVAGQALVGGQLDVGGGVACGMGVVAWEYRRCKGVGPGVRGAHQGTRIEIT